MYNIIVLLFWDNLKMYIVAALSDRPSQYLVRQITLKQQLAFKSNLVYR